MEDVAGQILDAIRGDKPLSDAEFNRLALDLHQRQLRANPFLKPFCEALGGTVPVRWQDIPAVPTSAFKRTEIRSFPPDQTLAWFQTSGTTEGESGRHFFQSLEWYEAAILPNFRAHLLPDGNRMRMAILTPPPEQAPHSSLVHMMEVVRTQLGTPESRYFLYNGDLQVADLCAALQDAVQNNEPVFLLGTAFSFVFFLDALAADGMRFELPAGSRIMETGGFKARTREVPRAEFYNMLSEALGVPQHHIVNEYGMTELSSQFYDRSMATGAATAQKNVPHWCRVRAVDPLTNAILPDGETGLLCIWDLANVGSVAVLQTEDVGVVSGETFEVYGRVAQSQPRGCSLGAEEALIR